MSISAHAIRRLGAFMSIFMMMLAPVSCFPENFVNEPEKPVVTPPGPEENTPPPGPEIDDDKPLRLNVVVGILLMIRVIL